MDINVLDLFSGIGGFSLGLERAGMKTVAFCEIDKKCQIVLKKHWSNLPIFEDITKLTGDMLSERIDVICGGFPCQDISFAGKGAGLAGERSGLWWEFHRLIKEIKPKFVIIENVSALRSRGLDEVLGSLAEIGYDAEWHCIPASAVGAPHQRDRIWIICYPHGSDAARKGRAFVTNDCFKKWSTTKNIKERHEWIDELVSRNVALQADSYSDALRILDGIPNRVDRLKQLGNSIVPQIAEFIGKEVIKWA
jgi:DNA (cytosine-5)-methyltransferase 1